jgi:hypothetical protein
VDQVYTVDIRNADRPYSWNRPVLAKDALFKNVTDSVGARYVQEERDYIDFNVQKLLPHKFSEYGPASAVGDIDGNGLEDLVIGGSAFHSAQLFLQQPGGKFIQKALLPDSALKNKLSDDLGILLFDADGDGHPDLFISSGGYENERNSPAYQDQIYLNDGKGNFKPDPGALPRNFTSKFCVRAADFDHDGDLDLFISGRVDPGNYPKPVSSFIYRNDSRKGHLKFTDVTSTVAPDLKEIGMVCDALWTDFDNDGWPDLIMAGEWMPLTFFKNDKGTLRNVTNSSGVSEHKGWWNSIIAGDFDNDGDMDYIVGNLGQNSFYRASEKYPVRVYAKDFDHNGIFDMIPSLYLPDSTGRMREFPAQGRDDLLKQINNMRKKFPTYRSFANADMNEVLTKEDRKNALILEANDFRSAMLRNDGNGKFTLIPLPAQAQFSVINGMVVDDFDGDGNLDLLINGNDYGTEPNVGRYDALNGLCLKGDGKGNFNPMSIRESGIFIPGNGKSLVKLRGDNGNYLLAATENRGPLRIYQLKEQQKMLDLLPGDTWAAIELKDGRKRKEEFYYGASFLSQSDRFLLLRPVMVSVSVTGDRGNKRSIPLH